MLMVEVCRLRLVGNSDSDGRGCPHGRRRCGGVAPMPIRKPDAPVVTDPKKAAQTLNWVLLEMENRYKLLATVGVRNIQSFN